jgi:hypothetical protein
MAQIFHGSTIVAKAASKTFSVRTGFKFRQEFLCATGSVAQGQYQTLLNQGYDPVEFNPSEGGGYVSVVANASFDPSNPTQAIFPSWQIDQTGGDTDLFDGRLNVTAKKLHPKHLQTLVAARKNPPAEGTFPKFDLTLTTATSNASDQIRLCHLLWTAYQMGEKGAPLELPVLRRSYNIWDSYTIIDTLNDVDDTIISSGTLISSEGVPAAYASIIPQSSTETISVGYMTFKWGWIKKQPKVSTIGSNQSQVTQEWHYGLWNATVTYTKAI